VIKHETILNIPEYLNASFEGDDLFTGDQLRKAILDEREACAKICDEIPALNPMFLLDIAYEAATLDCADAIRARGNNDV
jgi:hypothetical protein